MKYLLVSFLAIGLLLASACDNERSTGSGNVVTDDRTAGAFTTIDVDDAFEVTIRQGTEHRVLISADDNLISRINTSTASGTLRVRLGNGNFRNATLRVEITAPALGRIELSDAIRADLIDFVSGTAMIISVSDATSLEMSGSAPGLELEVNDASSIRGFNFTAATCTARVNDASQVDLTVTDRLAGRVRDASTFRFRGNPERTIETSGASSVIDAN